MSEQPRSTVPSPRPPIGPPPKWPTINGVEVHVGPHADLSGFNLRGASLRSARLPFANLTNADLTEADLSHSDLRGADLQGAKLQGAKLIGCDLKRADLQDCDLHGLNFEGADLKFANLHGANLRGASFANVSMQRADLRGADLAGATIWATFLDNVQFDSASLRGAHYMRPSDAPSPATTIARLIEQGTRSDGRTALLLLMEDGSVLAGGGCTFLPPGEFMALVGRERPHDPAKVRETKKLLTDAIRRFKSGQGQQ